MLKNLIFTNIILIAFFGSFYLWNKEIRSEIKEFQTRLTMLESSNHAIARQVKAQDKERLDYFKLQQNIEIWKETACINCHNTPALALPIYKRTIAEAMQIVRKGTNHSIKLGMPLYEPRGRDNKSITDSELKVRFDALFLKEILDFAPNPPADNRINQ